MGCVPSKQAEPVEREAKPAPVVQSQQPVSDQEPQPAAAAAPDGNSSIPTILPAAGSSSVAILPPWVNHTELEVSRRPSSVSTGPSAANDPAANALRSNLSEVRSLAGLHTVSQLDAAGSVL
jgi:hypothetical protein